MAGRVKKVERPQENWIVQLYIIEITKGLLITARHFFRNFFLHIAHAFGFKKNVRAGVVYEWPEDPRPVSHRLRGRHRLTKRPDGSPRCVACYMCETACPADCIHIIPREVPDPFIEKAPAQFYIDYSRCIFCGFCVEACPEDAIRMDVFDFHLSAYRREDMVIDLKGLLEAESSIEIVDGKPRIRFRQYGYTGLRKVLYTGFPSRIPNAQVSLSQE